ncbi:MAG: xanthine dehydrogenase family protein subunit M, partial [Deltaproteobacteria bacterium]
MKRYDYLKPKSLKEAISLKAQYGPRAMFIAGGTDVIVGIKAKKFSPEVLISLNGIEGMSYIREEDGHIK